VRGGRVVGAVLGVGAIAGAAFVFLRSKAASASTASPRERSWDHLPQAPVRYGPDRFPPLVERWRAEVQKRSGDLPVDALLEWLRIESGGDMCSIGSPTEVGIWQLAFPADAKYGATLEGLRAICKKSQMHNPADISWLSPSELDMEVGAGIRKIVAARDDVRKVFAQNGITWPETSFDFGSAVKQIHAAPAVITELVPKITHRDGLIVSWDDLHRRTMVFPVAQMGQGLRKLWNTPSRHGLKNRLEDTLANAEAIGHAWAVRA
jgi:hypothetical protein